MKTLLACGALMTLLMLSAAHAAVHPAPLPALAAAAGYLARRKALKRR